MNIGIMQPYFFPYAAYWQLINLVDKYVIYDDVNYIKNGWINRNKILINGQGGWLSLPLHKASQNKFINELELLQDPVYKKNQLKTIEFCYKKAPYYQEVFPVLRDVITQNEINLARYLEHSIRQVCAYLDIRTEIMVSSEINKNNNLKGKDKVIEICKILGTDHYINAIGGQELYSYEDFSANKIVLNFLETRKIEYKQFKNEFVPNLSIIDVMMFNSTETIKKIMKEYELEGRL